MKGQAGSSMGSGLLACALAVAVALMIAAPAANAGMPLINFWGNPSSVASAKGGEFAAVPSPAGIAVNGTSGDVYVIDASNNRVEQFSEDGAFIRAWGQDVVVAGAPNNANEMQAVMVNATGGQFTLTFGAETTDDLSFNATAVAVQSALNGLTSISAGGGSVSVSGGPGGPGGATPFLVDFDGGPLAGTDVAQLSAASGTSPLSGGSGLGAGEVAINTFTPGGGAGTGFEICDTTTVPADIAIQCKTGIAGVLGGSMSVPRGIAIDQASGNVYITDSENRRAQEFDAEGNFIRAWGKNTIASGPHGNGSGYEICSAADVCQAGESGTEAGAFAGTSGGGGFYGHPAVFPASVPGRGGNVVVADPQNARVQEFTGSGDFVRAFGWGVVLSGPGETKSLQQNQQVTVSATTGTFTLEFKSQKTGPIPLNALRATVETELNKLTTIGGAGGSVEVSGGPTSPAGSPTPKPYFVTFGGSLGGGVTDPLLGGDPTGLSGGAKTVTIAAVAGFQVCEPSRGDVCKAGIGAPAPGPTDPATGLATGTGGAGQFGPQGVARVAVDSSGRIYTAEPRTSVGTASNERVQNFTPQAGATSLLPQVFAPMLLSGKRSGGTAVDNAPVALVVDPVDDHIYVGKEFLAGEGSPPASATESRVLELNSAGNLLDTHMANNGIALTAGFPRAGSIAMRMGGGSLFVTSNTTAPRVYVFGNVAPPPANIAATTVEGETATLHGTVSPTLNPLSPIHSFYHFEYSKNNGLDWVKVPVADIDLGDGSGGGESSSCPTANPATCKVTQQITGLEASRDYRVRLIATAGLGGAATIVEGEFSTPALAPEATTGGGLWSSPPTTGPSLLLKGQVNPKNDETHYHFEYIDDATYLDDLGKGGSGFEHATQTPLTSAGGGYGTVSVAQILFGLDPAKSYRYRLVASNSSGQKAGQARSVAPPSAGDRFYERVSEGDSWGSGIQGYVRAISAGGERALFSAQAFGQPKSVPGPSTPFVASRGAGGWKVAAMVPEPNLALGSNLGAGNLAAADLGTMLWAEGTTGQRNRGEVRWGLSHLDGSLAAAYPTIVPLGHGPLDLGENKEYVAVGASSELSTFAFQFLSGSGSVRLFADEPLLPPAPGGRSNLYMVSSAGSPEAALGIVNRASDPSPGVAGAIIGGGCGASLGGNLGQESGIASHAVSADGSVIYFTARPGEVAEGACSGTSPKRIFKRIDGETTIEVSAPACTPTPACPGSPEGSDSYQGASADGSVVFFTTTRRLLNSDTDNSADLYAYDAKLPMAERLIQASAGEVAPGHPTIGSGAEVLGVFDNSADGSRAYFVAKGSLSGANPQGKSPLTGEPNLYVFERDSAHPSGRVALVGTLDPALHGPAGTLSGDIDEWERGKPGGKSSFALPAKGVEGDGHYLLFVTYKGLLAEDTDSSEDLYRYDDSSGGLRCLSCKGSESRGNGDFDAFIAQRIVTSSKPEEEAIAASDNVGTVVFSTLESLLAADQNSVRDVYLWQVLGGGGCTESIASADHAYIASGGGCLELVSGATEGFGVFGTARATAEAGLRSSGISRDGKNVFFITKAPLVATDTNNALDLYDARIGGGFAAQQVTAGCTSEEACHGPAEGAPGAATPASATLADPGNKTAPKPCKKGQVRKHGKCVKKPKAKHKKHHKRANNERGGKR